MTSFYNTNKSNSYPVAIYVFLGRLGVRLRRAGSHGKVRRKKSDKSVNEWTDDKKLASIC